MNTFLVGQVGFATKTKKPLYFCEYDKEEPDTLVAAPEKYQIYTGDKEMFVMVLENHPLVADKVYSKKQGRFIYMSSLPYWKVLFFNGSHCRKFYMSERILRESFDFTTQPDLTAAGLASSQ